MLEVSERQAQPKQPAASLTQAAPKKSISWKKVIVSVVVIAVVAGIISALLWYFVCNQTESTTAETTKVSTPGSKQATPSAEKGEAADWKTDTTNFMGVKFSLKYPPKFTVYRSYTADAVFTTDEGNRKFYVITNRKSLITNWKNGDVSLNVGIEDNPPSQEGVKFKDSMFAGLNAKMGTWSSQVIGDLMYYTNNQPGTPGKYFTFHCSFSPATDDSLKNICELMALTFKFLD